MKKVLYIDDPRAEGECEQRKNVGWEGKKKIKN